MISIIFELSFKLVKNKFMLFDFELFQTSKKLSRRFCTFFKCLLAQFFSKLIRVLRSILRSYLNPYAKEDSSNNESQDKCKVTVHIFLDWYFYPLKSIFSTLVFHSLKGLSRICLIRCRQQLALRFSCSFSSDDFVINIEFYSEIRLQMGHFTQKRYRIKLLFAALIIF